MPFKGPIRFSGRAYKTFMRYRPAIGSLIFFGLKVNDIRDGYIVTIAELVSYWIFLKTDKMIDFMMIIR